MNLVKRLLEKLDGMHYHQEYLCLSKEAFSHPLYAYIAAADHIRQDITESHLFVGYSPLVFAFSSSALPGPDLNTIDIFFSHKSLKLNEFFPGKDAIAWLSINKIHEFRGDDGAISFYQGARGRHSFIPKMNQAIIQLTNRLYKRKEGNVYLDANLYKQVQIAYSIPRKISLITLGDKNLYNQFPTDLHGRVGDQYIVSLRHEGMACQQVQLTKRIVLSDIHASAYKRVYSLGKNHMQPLKERRAFQFGTTDSKNFHLPLPADVLSYKELELKDSYIHGIHRVMLFKIVYEQKMAVEPATLAHIHNCYATWRYKHQISSNFLLR